MTIEKRFSILCGAIEKSNFDWQVEEYRNLMHCIRQSTSVLTPNFVEAHNLLDDWVTAFLTLLWNFKDSPFSITNLDSALTNNQDLTNFYSDIAMFIDLVLKSQDSNFKTAFRQFVRSWIEFGLGVMVVEELKDYFYCEVYSPETVQFRLEDHKLVEAITRVNDTTVHNNNTSRTSLKYTHYEKVSDNPTTWRVRVYETHSSGSPQYPTQDEFVDYTPIYIARYNTIIGSELGQGKGLQLFPILKQVANLLKSLDECASTMVTPIGFLNTELINRQNQANNQAGMTTLSYIGDGGYNQMLGGKVIRVEGLSDKNGAFAALNWNLNPAPAYEQLKFYLNQIESTLSRSKLFVAKGIARMTATESTQRNDLDEESITHFAATIIDEFLVPFLHDRVIYEINSRKTRESTPSLVDPLQNEDSNYALDDIDITLTNLISSDEAMKRTNQIATGIQLVSAITSFEQSTGGRYDISELVNEIISLWKLNGMNISQEQVSPLLDALNFAQTTAIPEGI